MLNISHRQYPNKAWVDTKSMVLSDCFFAYVNYIPT